LYKITFQKLTDKNLKNIKVQNHIINKMNIYGTFFLELKKNRKKVFAPWKCNKSRWKRETDILWPGKKVSALAREKMIFMILNDTFSMIRKYLLLQRFWEACFTLAIFCSEYQYSTRRIIGSRITESATYCNQELLVPFHT
jgi:hypothetical protein